MRKLIGLSLLVLFSYRQAFSQKQLTTAQQIWPALIGQARISERIGIIADASLRTREKFITGLSQGVLRAGLTYFLSERESISAGYAYFHNYPGDNHPHTSQAEHRLWQQIQWNTNNDKIRLQQRVRLEERFRRKVTGTGEPGEGYNFNYRTRFNLLLFVPLSNKGFAPKTLSFFIGDEAMLNFGKEIVYNTFDQNRVHVGFNYIFDARQNLQFGYMNIFQQQSSGNKYKNIHTARIYYFYNLDLRKKEQ